jgi:hypothetical protein
MGDTSHEQSFICIQIELSCFNVAPAHVLIYSHSCARSCRFIFCKGLPYGYSILWPVSTVATGVKVMYKDLTVVSLSVSRSWPDIYYSLTVTVLFLRDALSDERMGLSSIYATGPCQHSLSQVWVPWTRDHIWLSQIWDIPFCCLLQLAGSRWRYSTPPAHRCHWAAAFGFKITPRHGQCRKQHCFHCCSPTVAAA